MNLKPLRPASIPSAIEKAKHYRLLNEPFDAESTCRDVLAIQPDNQEALKVLVLSITDQFRGGSQRMQEAKDFLDQLKSEFDRHYFLGLVLERAGKSYLRLNTPESFDAAYDRLSQAMQHFEQAESLNDQMHDDAILRWNACARIIANNKLHPAPEGKYAAYGD
jgi:tetratricopeptide (TPR) repeat protein